VGLHPRELVVATSEVLDEGVSGADHSGGAKLFEAAHRPQPSLESPMICFDEVQRKRLGRHGDDQRCPLACRPSTEDGVVSAAAWAGSELTLA
jgi:hypothetical protein